MRVLASEVKNYLDKKVMVQGWVHNIRDLGGVRFIIVRDRSQMVQLVISQDSEHFQVELGNEYVVQVSGTVLANEKAVQGVEISVEDIEVLAKNHAELPISINRNPESLAVETILDNRVLSLRIPKIRKIFELQSEILRLLNACMHSFDFYEIKTSKIIGSGTEGGTGLFSLDYFDKKVFLAQSPQFYKQAMISSGLERVFETSHAYRAEKHDTPRHLNEYVSFDVEMAFIESEMDLIQLEKNILKYIFSNLADGFDFADYEVYIPSVEEIDAIPVIGYDEAKNIIKARANTRVFEINPEGERVLCEWAKEEHGVEAVFVNEFPRKKRPFYTYPKDTKTMSFDLLFRGLEITTGGKRINEYPMLLDVLPKFGLTEEGLGGYTEIFKYGCPPHGGFAIGVERLTQRILGLNNVKEASPFPRDRNRVTP
jgi:nondiscriminating aspartyl-tRNA synthetase